MNGLGNDFVIFDNRDFACGENIFQDCKSSNSSVFEKKNSTQTFSRNFKPAPTDKDFLKAIANRRTGIGCDQIIILSSSDTADVYMNIFNSDGSRAGACGNATRCVGKLILMANKNLNNNCKIETDNATLKCKLKISNNAQTIEVNMGRPILNPAKIPININHSIKQAYENCVDVSHIIDTSSFRVKTGFAVNFGNPHVVFLVNSINDKDLEKFGSAIENCNIFPEKTNVEFISELPSDLNAPPRDAFLMRVWERGGIITKACGSGACASFIAARHYKIINNKATVIMDGGNLDLSLNEKNEVLMTGQFAFNFEGSVSYDR